MDDVALADLLASATEDPRPEFTESMIDLMHRELAASSTVIDRANAAVDQPTPLITNAGNTSRHGGAPRARPRQLAWLASAAAVLLAVAFAAVVASTRDNDRSASQQVSTAPGSPTVSWTTVPTEGAGLGTGASFGAVASVGDAVILVGATPNGDSWRRAIWRSTNGTTWTLTKFPTGAGGVDVVAAHDDELVAIGNDGTDWFVWKSDDHGNTWNVRTQGPAVFGTPAPQMGRPTVDGLLWYNGRWIAYGAGSDGYEGVWISLDAIDWTQVQLDGSAGSAKIVPGANGELFGFWANTTWGSTDARTWTPASQASAPQGLFLRDVAAGATIAIGEQTEPHGQPTPLLRSNDNGATWHTDPSFLNAFPGTQIATITQTDNRWVAAGISSDQHPDAFVSIDGQNWNRLPNDQRGQPGGVLSLVAPLGNKTLILGTAPELDRYYIATTLPPTASEDPDAAAPISIAVSGPVVRGAAITVTASTSPTRQGQQLDIFIRTLDGCAAMSYGSATINSSGTATTQFFVPGLIGNVTCPGAGDFIQVEPGSYELAARISHTFTDLTVTTLQLQPAEIGTTYQVAYDAEDPCGAIDRLFFDGRYWKATNLAAFADSPRKDGGYIPGRFTPQTPTEGRFVASDGTTGTLKIITGPAGGC